MGKIGTAYFYGIEVQILQVWELIIFFRWESDHLPPPTIPSQGEMSEAKNSLYVGRLVLPWHGW